MFWLYLKAFHVIFMVTWFAGLFYLPRLFVYHAMSTDTPSLERFKIMERKLYFGIMTPGAVLTIISGALLIYHNADYFLHANWMLVKLACIVFLIIYHIFCGYYYVQFKYDQNKHGHKFYRYFNELPTLALFIIVIMVIVRPAL